MNESCADEISAKNAKVTKNKAKNLICISFRKIDFDRRRVKYDYLSMDWSIYTADQRDEKTRKNECIFLEPRYHHQRTDRSLFPKNDRSQILFSK